MTEAGHDKGEGGQEAGGSGYFSREVLEGVPWALASKAFLFLAGFAGVAVVTRGLEDREKFGVLRLCTMTAEYLLLLSALGLNTAIARFVPELRVKENRRGLINLLSKIFVAQLCMFVVVSLVVYVFKENLDTWLFKQETHYLLLFTLLIVLGRLCKTLIEGTLVALFEIKTVAILAVIYSVLWVGLTAFFLSRSAEVQWVLIAQSSALFFVTVFGGVYVFRLIRSLDWHSSGPGIGRRRILAISVPRQMNQSATLLTQRYSEIALLAFFFGPEIMAIYEFGNYLPFTALTFFPMALHGLFTSGFADAYTRNPNCLGKLITSYYKVLMVMVLPVSAFGAFFATDLIVLIGGELMAPAGPVASAFFIINLLPMIAMPLSLAIVAKEKVLHMQPLTFLKILVNLTLDWLLIKEYGIWGACAAVALTFFITSPIRLYVASRLLGGIYFPGYFFARILVVLFVLAYLFSLVPIESVAVRIFGLGPAYMVVYLCLIRIFRLIKPDDIAELREFQFEKVNRLLELITGTRVAG